MEDKVISRIINCGNTSFFYKYFKSEISERLYLSFSLKSIYYSLRKKMYSKVPQCTDAYLHQCLRFTCRKISSVTLETFKNSKNMLIYFIWKKSKRTIQRFRSLEWYITPPWWISNDATSATEISLINVNSCGDTQPFTFPSTKNFCRCSQRILMFSMPPS